MSELMLSKSDIFYFQYLLIGLIFDFDFANTDKHQHKEI